MFGPGRVGKKPNILEVRELSKPEVMTVVRAKNTNAVQRFKDSHHMLARLFAMGLRPGQVASRAGYSLARVSTLSADPAFQELIACYRKDVNESFKEGADEYFDVINSNRIIAARLLNDKLNGCEADDITFSQLVAVHSDAADRTGYPKRSVAVNVNVDFAAQLDKAIKRSAAVAPLRLVASLTGGGARSVVEAEVLELTPTVTAPTSLRRRA